MAGKKSEVPTTKPVKIEISPDVNDEILAIAESTGRTRKVTAEWIMKKGIVAFKESRDPQLKDLLTIWGNLTVESRLHLVAAADSFLRLPMIVKLMRERTIAEPGESK